MFELWSKGGDAFRRVLPAVMAISIHRNQEKIDKDGESHTFEVAAGDNLLDIAQANDLEMEGACGGSCACSTCHVIVESDDMYDKIPEASDDENDMLDLAFGLTETSRLGCQVQMSPELDGLVVKLPQMTRNMQASDFEKR
ncbi:mitochondrial matrix iron-sulfur protein [Knufia peltigerae]|uniref:Mitochondrial matrix iron-sulfur protein n=1 Tax=Knufia peltigerae TaxID=1002370 RepID=A0AA38Y675_9EURO|nr:mitochondrial matrix iron-sulfur protein [Knufia peltigerae]